MEIKDKLVLNGINWAASDEIKYSTIGAFQTSNSNTPVYYIFWWTDNAYNLQYQYKCHAFYPPVIIYRGELVCPAKFMTPMRKTSYWYHDPGEAIPFMVKLKQAVITYIELIQDNNTTDKFPSRFKVYADMNPHLLSEHDHQIILDKIEARENLNHDEYVDDENYYNADSDDSNDDDNK